MLQQGSRVSRSLIGLLLCLGVAACGEDNGGSEPPPVTRVVYLADQDTAGVDELYLVGSSIKLNPALPIGRGVLQGYTILPDRSGVVYEADQDNDDVYELYLVKFDKPGVSMKLNPPLTGNQDVSGVPTAFRIIPDGSGVVYRADQDADNVDELYVVRFVAPGTSIKLNGPLVNGGDVSSFEMLPNSTGVVYVADQDIDEKAEAFLVRFATPGSSQKLNPPLASDRDILPDPLVLPDSTGVVYQANETSTSFELYRVLFSAPGSSTKINGPFARTFTSLSSPAITPDGTSVVFLGPGASSPQEVLYRVTFANPGVNIELSSPLVRLTLDDPGYRLLPDSSGVIYSGDPDGDTVYDLFRTNFSTPGVSVKISGPPSGDFRFRRLYRVAPDSQSVVYATPSSTFRGELRHINLATPGVTTLLQGPPLHVLTGGPGFIGAQIRGMEVTPDSRGVLYVGVEGNGPLELFQVNFATPATATRQNGPLVTNGSVTGFAAR